MDLHSRTRRNLLPVVGGMTAVATATGAFKAVAHVAPAGAGQDSASAALGAAGAGTFESCDAYFGFGKHEGLMLGAVDFDVLDTSGDDGVAHDVAGDTNVRFVLENEDGDVLECVPVEITEEQWEDAYDELEALPDYPGPGHFAYPSVDLFPQEIDGFGVVVDVGFRVTTIPGQHSLVAPTGVQDLPDIFVDIEALLDGEVIGPQVLAFLATEVNQAAADAFEAALETCQAEDPLDGTDADLVAAAQAIVDRFEESEVITEVSCEEVTFLQVNASIIASANATADYTETIELAVADAPTPPPAAQPVDAAPQFTG
jgi:hypothetical protein